jgi:hypothetical protein
MTCRPLLFFFLCVSAASAVINPNLQPVDLFGRYLSVVSGTVVQLDREASALKLEVRETFKGQLPQATIDAVFSGDVLADFGELRNEGIDRGTPFVAYVGKRRSRGRNDVMFFMDGWYLGRARPDGNWAITRGDTALTGKDGVAVETLLGTWNGRTEQLARMMRDIKSERSHFPRRAYARFKPDRPILADEARPIEGLAFYDLDLDGDLDIFVASPGGDRLLLQTESLKFVDATTAAGVTTRSSSCSVADVNGDAMPDVLAGLTVLVGRRGPQGFSLEAVDLLPKPDRPPMIAMFAELNADGKPDILVSAPGGGLRGYLNPGGAGAAFSDASDALGLRRPECGREETGYVTQGDWNGDGRTDLFYAGGKGVLLLQGADGAFSPVAHDLEFDFRLGGEGGERLSGAGCFMPLFPGGQLDLLIPQDSAWLVIENQQGKPIDVTEYGNEISEAFRLQVASAGSDLNVDGHVDFYTVSDAPNGHNRFIVNRGYGSFMLGSVHQAYGPMFSGPAHKTGGSAVVTADADGDGAEDILLGNRQGVLTLILNDTLTYRQPVEHPTGDELRLNEVGILSVQVTGLSGVVGACVRVKNDGRRVLGRADLGGNNATGCRGPDTVNFALRETGRLALEVRYADGLERKWTVEVKPRERTKLVADRGDEW